MGLPQVLLIGGWGAYRDISSSVSTHCFSRMPRGYSSAAQTHGYSLPSCGGASNIWNKSGCSVRIIGGVQGESEGEAAGILVSGPSGVTTVSPPDVEMWKLCTNWCSGCQTSMVQKGLGLR